MELRNATALILGGSGLVGRAVARRLLDFAPKRIVITGLVRHDAEAAVRALEPHARGTELSARWGNIFHPCLLYTSDAADE